MSIDLNIIGENVLNLKIYQQIQQSLKVEPILTSELNLKDINFAFDRIEKHHRFVTTLLCHPSTINDIRKCSKMRRTNHFVEQEFPSDLTEEEIINNPSCGLVGYLWIGSIRVCNKAKTDIIWVCSNIPEDDLFVNMTNEDMIQIKTMAEKLLEKLSIPFGIPTNVTLQKMRENLEENSIDDNIIISCPIIINKGK